jgi:hypothetical protein
VGFALAWMALVVILGWGAHGAHADTRADDEGASQSSATNVLGSVLPSTGTVVSTTTDAVDHAVTSITHTVAGTTKTAEKAVAKLRVARNVVKKVTDASAAVTRPVEKAARQGVVKKTTTPVTSLVTQVTHAVAPVVKAVEEVPVVGAVVKPLDVNGTLGAVTSTVSGAVADVSSSVDTAVGGTVDAVTLPTRPADPTSGTPAVPGEQAYPAPDPVGTGARLGDAPTAIAGETAAVSPAPASSAATVVETEAWLAQAFADVARTALAGATASIVSASGHAPAWPASPALGMAPGVLAPSGASFSASSGAGPAAAALLIGGFFFAHRAWARRGRPDDDATPPAPLFATDVSPD